MALTLWHNPRCSKSRAALSLLEDRGVEPEVRLYLKTPPTPGGAGAGRRIGRPLREILRRKEAPYRELTSPRRMTRRWRGDGREPDPAGTPHPRHGTRAVIGRPPEDILALL
jgi:arsenate reductase